MHQSSCWCIPCQDEGSGLLDGSEGSMGCLGFCQAIHIVSVVLQGAVQIASGDRHGLGVQGVPGLPAIVDLVRRVPQAGIDLCAGPPVIWGDPAAVAGWQLIVAGQVALCHARTCMCSIFLWLVL